MTERVKMLFYCSRIRGTNRPSILPHQYHSWETSPPQTSRWAGRPCAASTSASAHLEVWGGDVSHEWYWWGKMLGLFVPRILEK